MFVDGMHGGRLGDGEHKHRRVEGEETRTSSVMAEEGLLMR